MPIGSLQSYPTIIANTCEVQPDSVLDVGIGFGMNGAGVRNWWNSGYMPLFKTRLVGVEIFEQYKNPVWDIYDEVIIGDILDVLPNLGTFDVIIISDVIEHFEKNTGFNLLKLLQTKVNKRLIVTTPAIFMEQGAVYGNEGERHRSLWSPYEFEQAGLNVIDRGDFGFLRHKMLIGQFDKP